jgi:biotin carboxyl carrier protein
VGGEGGRRGPGSVPQKHVVQKGDTLWVENHIIASREGTIVELSVEEGKTVETGALIAVIE